MALTDISIRGAKPADKKYRLTDGQRLALEIYPNGIKHWRFRYTFAGKKCELALGQYPAVSLSDARKARDRHNVALQDGIDPAGERRERKRQAVERVLNTFGSVMESWLETWDPMNGQRAAQLKAFAERGMPAHEVDAKRAGWKRTYQKLCGQVKHLEALREIPFADVNARQLLDACQKVEAAGKSVTAHELRSSLNSLYRHAVLLGLITPQQSPTDALKGGLLPMESKGRAAVTDPAELGKLLRDVEGYNGSVVTKGALTLGLLTFVRPGELRYMEWAEIDFDKALWTIPGHKMKRDVEHLVPLSRQALAELGKLRHMQTMMRLQTTYVFPSRTDGRKPMSENTVNTGLRTLGWPGDAVCGHGFRATASTLLAQVLKADERWIERQLSHAEKNKVKAAYNRAEFLPDRTAMMQDWADWLDHLRKGAPVVPLAPANAG